MPLLDESASAIYACFVAWVYSIDESFVDVTGIRGDITERRRKVRQRNLQWIGTPYGIGQTKTLAKLANCIAETAGRKTGSYGDDMPRSAT